MYLIVIEPANEKIVTLKGTTFFDAIRNAGLFVSYECGGLGTCGKCKIVIEPAPETTKQEMKVLKTEEIQRCIRLSCQHKVESNAKVDLLHTMNQTKILERSNGSVGSFIPDIGDKIEYGIAFDVGTTTIVGYLVEMKTGIQLSSTSALNPQARYGEDIATRLTFAMEDGKAKIKLKNVLLQSIEKIGLELIRKHKLDIKNLAQIAFVGNTAMHHLFLGLDIDKLAVAPYQPQFSESRCFHTKELGFETLITDIYTAPLLGGYVGSDITAFIVAHGLYDTDEKILGIDIGTNGEIVLSNQGNLSVCSTAAGSAFEGASISHGMRGEKGAIERIIIRTVKSIPEITVIGQVPPRGLCGSGIVDLVSNLLNLGIIGSDGELLDSSRNTNDDSLGLCYVVNKGNEKEFGERILFSQQDIRQVQLAKSAISTGISILLDSAEVKADSIDKVLLAGAFGNYVAPESAMRIGLLPTIDAEKIHQVGNAAGLGARLFLNSTEARSKADHVRSKVTHVDLSRCDDFQARFVANTLFP